MLSGEELFATVCVTGIDVTHSQKDSSVFGIILVIYVHLGKKRA